MKLLIASHNPAKIKEYKKNLSEMSVETISLADLNIEEESSEGEETFEENAIKKVKFYKNLTGFPAIGDDGGLMIDALGGEPGVKSRYWLGYKMSDEELIETVMEKMKGVPSEKRKCRLVGVIAFITLNNEIYTEWAEIEGMVAEKPIEKRMEGYPYRSFFYLKEFGKYYVELNEEEHKKINHRRETLLKMKPYLKKLM